MNNSGIIPVKGAEQGHKKSGILSSDLVTTLAAKFNHAKMIRSQLKTTNRPASRSKETINKVKTHENYHSIRTEIKTAFKSLVAAVRPSPVSATSTSGSTKTYRKKPVEIRYSQKAKNSKVSIKAPVLKKGKRKAIERYNVNITKSRHYPVHDPVTDGQNKVVHYN